ncbi:MAG TPA: hypothetical protein VGC58_00305 [Candidatus Paceibacterota bacterium]
MAQEGYEPNQDEIKQAEDLMSGRQEYLTEERGKVLAKLSEMGISEADALEAAKSVDPDRIAPIMINGHQIEAYSGGTFLDGKEVSESLGQDAIIKLRKLYAALYELAGGTAQSGEVETERLVREGKQAKEERDLQEAKTAQQEALKDIFG